ncbi:MAG: hypothetical protein M3P89_13920 [Actinomycetota bacterium]|nr:hypothetical protein [Actinomycetota bacterium]
MSEQHPPTAAYSSAGATAYGSGSAPATAPEHASAQGAPRRQDPVGSLLLLVSGIAAGISLLLRWLADSDITGLSLVRDGFSALGRGVGSVLSTGYVQPLTVVLGGGVLFLLGLLLLVPARRHRAVGLLALVVALLVAVAVLVPLAIAGWALSFFGVGFWFAIAVAVLGLLGGLKALLTR